MALHPPILMDSTAPQQEIFRHADAYGPLIVSEGAGFRQLTFGSHYEQSVLCLEKPHGIELRQSVIDIAMQYFAAPHDA